jgi:hypothetical protein
VKLFNVDPATGTGTEYAGFFAFDPAFLGGAAVAGAPRAVMAGAGPGGGPEIRLFPKDYASDQIGPAVGFLSGLPYPATFGGGVRLGCAPDRWDDGLCNLVAVAPGPGGAPHVRLLWNDLSGEEVGFLPYDPLFRGGLFVATGYISGRWAADVVTAPGAGGAPLVRVFKLSDSWPTTVSLLAEFFAYDPGLAGGVTVAVGDVLGTGTPQIVTGTGPGGAPHIRVFSVDPVSGVVTPVGPGFFAYPPGFIGGASVAVANVDGTGAAELITGTGPGGGPHVRIWKIDPTTGDPTEFGPGFFAYDPAFLGGVNVSGGFLR